MSRAALSLLERERESESSARAVPGEAAAQPEIGNQAMKLFYGGGLRAKLEVGGADDPEEREADRLAEQVLAGRSAGPCACGGGGCSACGGKPKIRRQADGGAAPAATGASFGNRAGRPLGLGTRRHFEPRFGADLSSVRIHDDPATHDFARGIGARAFAIGSDIGFAEGRHRPGTAAGDQLLAHELAHVALGHGGVRRDGEKGAAPPAAKTPPPDFDPCAVDVPSLTNIQLISFFGAAEGYVEKYDKDKRKGEDRYYDYRNLRNRLITERSARAKTGHAWLNDEINFIPETLYGLESSGMGLVITVKKVPGSAVGGNIPAGGLIVTPRQFEAMLAAKNIPHVDIADYFAKQDPNAPQDLDIPVPMQDAPRRGLDPSNFYIGQPGQADPFHPMGPLGIWGVPSRARASFGNQFLWQNGFTNPVVTAGPFGYSPAAREGFRTDTRGDLGEILFRGTDPATASTVVDLNTFEPNFTLYDYMDPRTSPAEFGSIKTQLPQTPGADASLRTFLEANSELFGNADPAKRAAALAQLQTHVDSTLTEAQMLRQTRFRVNPDVVPAARAAQTNAIRRAPKSFNAILNVKIQDAPVTLVLKNKTSKTYNDIASLHADYDAKRMSEQKYRGAIADLAILAQDSIQPGVGTAEGDFRPLLDIRQAHDFLNASEFLGTPNTEAGKRAARARQRAIYEQMATAEYLEAMRTGIKPGTIASAKSGGKMGFGTAVVFDLPSTIANWDKDPYAGRRYLLNVGLSTAGGYAQGASEYLVDQGIMRGSLAIAASRAEAGGAIAPIANATSMARFGGTTVLGGAFSGGITIGGMVLDEQLFGADYSTIDYAAKGARAAYSGALAAETGAIATGMATAYLVGGGGAAGCTVIVPGVGTLACGTVGAGVGFLVGVGTYIVSDWVFGDTVEAATRDALGEQGCKK